MIIDLYYTCLLDCKSMDQEDLKALDKLFNRKLNPIGEKLEVIEEKVDSHSVSLINLEKEIKTYMDALDVERKRIDKHDQRLDLVEESLDFKPSI